MIRRKLRNLTYYWHRLVGNKDLRVDIHWGSFPLRAGLECDDSYLTAHYYFNEERFLKDLKPEQYSQEVMHETIHELTYPICRKLEELGCSAKEVERLEEQLTTRVERAVWAAYNTDRGDHV